MSTTSIVGDIGGRLDIQVKVGNSVGPFLLKFPKSDGTYTSFTGYALSAKARTRQATPVSIAMTATLADPAAHPGADWATGQAILLKADKTESAKFESPATMTSIPKLADWQIEATAPDGTLTTLLYGEIQSFLRLP